MQNIVSWEAKRAIFEEIRTVVSDTDEAVHVTTLVVKYLNTAFDAVRDGLEGVAE